MRKANSKRRGALHINQTYEAEGLEMKLRRITESKEPIEDEVPIVYTDKKDGVLPGYDIRTDRFEIAREAMEKLGKAAEASRIAKGQSVPGEGTGEVRQEPS